MRAMTSETEDSFFVKKDEKKNVEMFAEKNVETFERFLMHSVSVKSLFLVITADSTHNLNLTDWRTKAAFKVKLFNCLILISDLLYVSVIHFQCNKYYSTKHCLDSSFL
jgi:hypothetical protein